jgi:hypothetical protein
MKSALCRLVAGLLLSLSLTANAASFYVDGSNLAPAWPYRDWVSAATNIQDAVDVAAAGDEIVVTNKAGSEALIFTAPQLGFGRSLYSRQETWPGAPMDSRSVIHPTVIVVSRRSHSATYPLLPRPRTGQNRRLD